MVGTQPLRKLQHAIYLLNNTLTKVNTKGDNHYASKIKKF